MKGKRTNHTILVKVASHGSGGRGHIIRSHDAVTSKYTELRSPFFSKYDIGTFLVVKVKLSGKRRMIQWVQKDETVWSTESFRDVYDRINEQEFRDYDIIHGKPTGVGVLPLADEIKTSGELAGWPEDEDEIKISDGRECDWGEEPWVDEEKPEEKPEDTTEWLEKIYIGEQDEKVLATLNKLSNKKHVAVMMVGPSGYGKTSIPQQKALDWNMNFLRWDCSTVRDPEEFFGFRGAVDGSTMTEEGETFFAESEFTKVVEKGNAVIVLDELNRIDPYISNILFPLLDHAGKTSVAGHEVVVGPNVMFFATVNLGFQFTGTFTLDAALTNRFAAKILVNALPGHIETKILIARGGVDEVMAKKIVKLMQGLRILNSKDKLSIDASTRVSIQIAELVGCGLDLKSSLVYVVINGISEEEAKLVIDQLGFVL